MSGVQRFRKLPVVVDAIQWDGSNEEEIAAWSADLFRQLEPEDRANCADPDATAEVFDKLHSTWVLVLPGQWVVRGVKGEFYPIAADVLAETYEPVASG